MNRRNFLKNGSVVLGGVTVFSDWNFVKRKSELEDLYSYLESHTILTPLKGKVPFKLYPHQKKILKHIHENDKVVIVKARQIGMTTLLAGYLQWRNGLYDCHTCSLDMNEYFEQAKTNFFRNQKRKDFDYCFAYDEYNYKGIPIPYTPIKNVEKLIIVGTPDRNGNLKYVVDNKDRFGLKVFTYSAYDCYPMWDRDKINGYREFSKYFESKSFLTDVKANFV